MDPQNVQYGSPSVAPSPETAFMESLPSSQLIADHVKGNRVFKIHAALAIIISLGTLTVWTLVELWVWSGFPWFFYPICACCMSLSFHYYMFLRPTKEILNLHVAWFVIVNLMLFFTWISFSANSVWFLFPVFGWGIFLGAHFCLVKYRNEPTKWLYVHATAFVLLNLLLFVIYMNQQDKGFAWPIIVLLFLGFFFLFHWNSFYHKGNYWRMHVSIFADAQLLIFLLWEMVGKGIFPFFIPILVGWGVLLALHYWKYQKSAPEDSNNGILSFNSSSAPPPSQQPTNYFDGPYAASSVATQPPLQPQNPSNLQYPNMYAPQYTSAGTTNVVASSFYT